MQQVFLIGTNWASNELCPQVTYLQHHVYNPYPLVPDMETPSQTGPGLLEYAGALAMGACARGAGKNKKRRGRKENLQLDRSQRKEEDKAQAEILTEDKSQPDPITPPHDKADEDAEEEDHSKEELIKACYTQLEGTESEHKAAIATILENMHLAFDQQGCRLVQHVFDIASHNDKVDVAEGLKGEIPSAVKSPNANHVVQKIIEVLPTSKTSFVAEELLDIACDVARHRYACRIVCRLLEHAGEESTNTLVDALLKEAENLSRHQFGYIVMRSVLEHGTLDQQGRVVQALQGQLARLAKQKWGSLVVEKALASRDPNTRIELANELLETPDVVAGLATHQFGHYVVKELTRAPGDCAQRALDIIHRIPHKHVKRCLKR
jgi:hypothetical protein